jgi:hypothetical protein
MPRSDPHFSHLSHTSREEVFGRLYKALNEMATYIPQLDKIRIGKLAWSMAFGANGNAGHS